MLKIRSSSDILKTSSSTSASYVWCLLNKKIFSLFQLSESAHLFLTIKNAWYNILKFIKLSSVIFRISILSSAFLLLLSSLKKSLRIIKIKSQIFFVKQYSSEYLSYIFKTI